MRAHEEVRHLEWRVRLFGAGALLALAGMASGTEWLVNVALGVLLLGFALRFVPERGGEEERGDTAEEGPPA